jgi:hypothetical protein
VCHAGLVETRFPSQRLQRSRRLTLGTAMVSGMASRLTSALALAGASAGARAPTIVLEKQAPTLGPTA